MSDQNVTAFTTGTVRAAFVNVWEPVDNLNSGKEKYSMCLIIRKEDEKTLDRFRKAEAAVIAAVKAANSGKLPKNFKLPLRDADDDEDKEDNPAFEGCYFVNVSSVRKPKIVDRELEEIKDEELFYSGVYCRVKLNLFSFEKNGNKGIAVGFSNVQKVKSGDHIGGGSTKPEDDFAEEIDDDDFDEFD